ncbi:MAG: hypothetical protein ACTSX6_10345 [Candidatus Heimdallarchaeaceae archaeon]
MKKNEVKVCPVCNSQDVSQLNIHKFEQRCAFFRDVCNNCGYMGPMSIMKKKDADKLKVLKPKIK